MTKAVEVITSVQRRRRWSRAEKERIVAATMEPGAVASEIARAAGIHTSQLFRWREWGREMFFELPGSNKFEAANSIAKLMSTKAKIVHPGHYQSFTNDKLQRLASITIADLKRL